MPDVPYTVREIDAKFLSVETLIKQSHEAQMLQLNATLAQATKTNGRVNNLEFWSGIMKGGLAVVILVVLPMLGWAMISISNIQTTIDKSIQQAIKNETFLKQ